VRRDPAASRVPAFARAEFAADWGVRICRQASRATTAGHGGGVWPLFTGWVALADFLAGRPGSAWERLSGLLGLVRHFDPAWSGMATASPMGVCRHQA
jgi:hypothetical protein